MLGAGLAGLAAAQMLAEAGVAVTLVERDERVGGMASSWKVGPYWLDHGPHRFHSRDPELLEHLYDVLDGEVVIRERRSRIHLLGRWFDYPLRTGNVLRNLPPGLLARALADYAATRVRERLRPTPDAHFEAWVTKRFGRTLYELFFGAYTAKAWGMPCDRISADWASQRIAQADLWDAIRRTLFPPRDGEVRSLVSQFFYPARGGIGELARRYARRIERAGGRVLLGRTVERVEARGGRARAVVLAGGEVLPCDELVSTIPIQHLARGLRLDGAALGADVERACASTAHIGIVFVYLEVQRPSVVPDHWIYLPSPELAVHRLSEFKNFSDDAAPGASTAVCCEITCRPGDARWRMAPAEAERVARADLARIGLIAPDEGRLLDVARLAQAYPVYDLGYRAHVQALRKAVRAVGNLTSTGRQGLFRYNNMDHSIAMGRHAARALLAGRRASGALVASGAEHFG